MQTAVPTALQPWLLVHSAKTVKLAALLAIILNKIALAVVLASFITTLAVSRLVQTHTIPTAQPTNALLAPITAPLAAMQPRVSPARLPSPTFPANVCHLARPLCPIA